MNLRTNERTTNESVSRGSRRAAMNPFRASWVDTICRVMNRQKKKGKRARGVRGRAISRFSRGSRGSTPTDDRRTTPNASRRHGRTKRTKRNSFIPFVRSTARAKPRNRETPTAEPHISRNQIHNKPLARRSGRARASDETKNATRRTRERTLAAALADMEAEKMADIVSVCVCLASKSAAGRTRRGRVPARGVDPG